MLLPLPGPRPAAPAGPLPKRKQRLADALSRHAPIHRTMDPWLAGAVKDVLANPGGLFRAELAWQTARACGLAPAQAERLACAIEYFHIASLMFDDLPIMDDAYWRRGELCAHLRHGQGTATLAALALITRAYALAGAAIARAPAKRQLAAHLLIDRCLGAAGMLDGQAKDLDFQPEPGGSRATIDIAMTKTVPLIRLALALPAILGGVDETWQRMLRRLSVCWGLFYQGVDDLKDQAEFTGLTGKATGQDERLGRPNIARELGPEATARYLDRLARSARNRVDALTTAAPQFAYLASYHQLLLRRREQLPRILP